MKTENINNVILNILHSWHMKEDGFWRGYTRLMIEAKEETGKDVEVSIIKQSLKELRKQGMVFTAPIFSERTGKLIGKGWFYNDCDTIEMI